MKRYTLLLVLFLALTACVSEGDAPPATTTAQSTLASVTPPTLAQTIERPPAPAPPPPVPLATPAPSGFTPPAAGLLGISDGLVLVPPDGSLIVYTPADGRVETLLGPGDYTLSEDSGAVYTTWPPRFSPDGRLMVVPRPAGDTWLIRRGPTDDPAPLATVSRLHDLRLWFTWAPDSRRIVYTLAGLAADASPGAVYVQDVMAGNTPRLLVDLPPFAAWPVWSPGCADAAAGGDCGRSIAVSAAGGGAITIWLVDATTGAARPLGRFRPPGVDGHLWHRWAADGTGVIAQADGLQIFFPLAEPARPLVWELVASSSADPSPGKRLLTIDTTGRPAAQSAPPLGVDVIQVGLESVMIGQATEVETQPWATAAVVSTAGPPETWPRREWAGPGLALAVPAGWRAQPLDQHHFAIANYDVITPGLLVLADELFRADLFWSSYPGDQAPPFSVQALREGYYNKHVSEIQIGGVTGAVLADPVTPLCETIVLPHDTPGVRGQLWTTYCPATEQWRSFVVHFLEQMQWAVATGGS